MSNKPTLLIATPAYGGMFTKQYLESMLDTWDWLGKEQIQVATYFIENESLITRARNTCASLAYQKRFEKLLFIDADIGWKPDDVSRLYYSDKKLIGGIYPWKSYPITMNWNASRTAGTPYSNGECEAHNVATGFLMIDWEVLHAVAKLVPTYSSTHMNREERTYHDFFSVGVHEGQYESEDWRFCRLAKEAGYTPWVNLKTVLTHTGTHTWDANKE